jgi:hypothetical protein
VVDAFDYAITTPEMTGPYNVTAPNPVKMQDLAEAIGLVLNTHAKARVPKFALELVLGKERAEMLLTGQRASSQKLEDAGFAFSYRDIVPALEELIGPK